jgi:hypothetical protein
VFLDKKVEDFDKYKAMKYEKSDDFIAKRMLKAV